MKKKLILIGNKPPFRKDLASEIQSFDYVMRVNRMNYLEQTAVNRLDGLFLEANEVFKYICEGGEHKDKIKQMKNILMHKDWYDKFDEWNEYLTEEQFKNIELINPNHGLREIGFAHLLNEEEWRDEYDISITCLDIENRAFLIDNQPNWDYHKGGGIFEQIYLIRLLKSGQIQRVLDYE